MILVGTHNKENRDVWLEKTLNKIPRGLRILDAGAGELQYKSLCQHLKYVSQDFAQYNGEGNGEGLQTGAWDQTKLDIISDITAIPEPENSFDAIMCIEVFEHLPEPIKAIKEFSRLLRPGGHLILTAPFCSLTHFAPYYFYTGFNRNFYQEHLSKNGFDIIELVENGNYFEYLGQECRRVPSIGEKYANKKTNIYQSFAMKIVLSMLDQFSKKDTGSSDLLHFGCQVHAIKKD